MRVVRSGNKRSAIITTLTVIIIIPPCVWCELYSLWFLCTQFVNLDNSLAGLGGSSCNTENKHGQTEPCPASIVGNVSRG